MVALIFTVPVPYLDPFTPVGVDGKGLTIIVITLVSTVPSPMVVVLAVLL